MNVPLHFPHQNMTHTLIFLTVTQGHSGIISDLHNDVGESVPRTDDSRDWTSLPYVVYHFEVFV